MKIPYFGTLFLILVSTLVTLLAPVFDSSVYGIEGHPTLFLSFFPKAPLRHFGSTLFFSLFIHQSFQHLIVNLVLLLPVCLMIERKKNSSTLLGATLFIHFLVLSILMITPVDDKAFLGLSHVVTGLYSFWAVKTKGAILCIVPMLILLTGYFQDESHFTTLTHGIGLIVGILLGILTYGWEQFQTKRSH